MIKRQAKSGTIDVKALLAEVEEFLRALATAQISRSKPDSFHRTPAGFTALALDGDGLCDILPARPTSKRMAGRLGSVKRLPLYLPARQMAFTTIARVAVLCRLVLDARC